LDRITTRTAAVVVEAVQAERGVFVADKKWMKALRKKCTETGALLIFDEIQTGFGRTGTLWAFEQLGIVPDVLVLGKALGGGMPLGAFIAKRKLMMQLAQDPVLGHITTFGGHPVSCAAGLAAFRVLFKEKLIEKVNAKAELFKELLNHSSIKAVRLAGLLIAVEFEDAVQAKKVIDHCIKAGALTDWFLFAPHCLRIAPPLTITTKEIRKSCRILMESLVRASK
jgi:acetylornithine/succinyldiaminopimelate/putrescine aminotransferase